MKEIKKQINYAIALSLKTLSFPEKDYSLTPPKNNAFGDLSSNI